MRALRLDRPDPGDRGRDGVWEGDGVRAPYGPAQFRLELEQRGPNVNGNYRVVGGGPARGLGATSGAIDGTVAGDTIKFKATNGVLVGEAVVAGEEMTGSIQAGVVYRLALRRTSSTLPSAR